MTTRSRSCGSTRSDTGTPQGLAWDERGRLVVAEHGPIGHDEINRILPGQNYGCPGVQGRGGDSRYQDPMVGSKEDTGFKEDTWAASEISFCACDLFVATLRGRRLPFRMAPRPDLRSVSSLTPMLVGGLRPAPGRDPRDPTGPLYTTTSNCDGRGELRGTTIGFSGSSAVPICRGLQSGSTARCGRYRVRTARKVT